MNGITILRTVHVKLLDSLLVLVSMENVDFAIFARKMTRNTKFNIAGRRRAYIITQLQTQRPL